MIVIKRLEENPFGLLLKIFLFGLLCNVQCLRSTYSTLTTGKYLSLTNVQIEADMSIFRGFTYTKLIRGFYDHGLYNISGKDFSQILFDPTCYRKQIQDGDIVVVRGETLDLFIHEVFNKIDKSIILVCHSYKTFPDEYPNQATLHNFLENDRLIWVFAQNFNPDSGLSRVSFFPLGLPHGRGLTRFRDIGLMFPKTPSQQDNSFDLILKKLAPTDKRKPTALCDFLNSKTGRGRFKQLGEDRSTIAQKLREQNVCDFLPHRVPLHDLLSSKGEYAFDISPPGTGFDCYRT